VSDRRKTIELDSLENVGSSWWQNTSSRKR